jgi:uncharacterized membrane protein
MADENAGLEPEERDEEGQVSPEQEPEAQQGETYEEEPVTLQPAQEGPPKPDIGEYLSEAWDVVINNAVLLILGFFVLYVILALASCTIIGGLIVAGPLAFGYLRVLDRRMREEPAEFGDLFGGFQDFGKALVTYLLVFGISLAVSIVVVLVAIVLMLIPCLGQILAVLLMIAAQVFLAAALLFVFPVAALSDRRPGEALKQSVAFCRANLWPTVLFALVVLLIAGAGSLVCGVGTVLTAPIAIAMVVKAYHDYYLPNAPEDV